MERSLSFIRAAWVPWERKEGLIGFFFDLSCNYIHSFTVDLHGCCMQWTRNFLKPELEEKLRRVIHKKLWTERDERENLRWTALKVGYCYRVNHIVLYSINFQPETFKLMRGIGYWKIEPELHRRSALQSSVVFSKTRLMIKED